MINNKTVFLLGAGASQPFGFPLGVELRRNVLEKFFSTTGHAVHLYNTTTFEQAQVNEFVQALKYSGLQSVDAFLERRPEFMEVGKATMAVDLALTENHDNLWMPGSNWMLYLYSSMITGSLEEFAGNEIAFVTFNYDRSLEHFLFTSLKNSFAKSDAETKAVLDHMPIIHLHGRLGYLPWQSEEDVVPYGIPGISKPNMDVFLKQIKVVHEEITDGRDKDFDAAKRLLANADRIYLLGFGFGGRNVERLGLKDLHPKLYQGSAYAMTPKEAATCSNFAGGNIGLHHNYACLEFLRNVAILD